MITDMTQGSPSKILWKFSIPMLLSIVFQQLYNIIDSIVAGQFIGENALAAVGASYPITMIFMAVATGLNIGCSVIISQLFGAKEFSDLKTAVNTSIISSLGLSIILTVFGILMCNPLLKLLNTPDNILDDSAIFLRIYIGGLVFLFLYNICTGIFTALGDSKTPLYFLIMSSLGNIFLDLIFVICFKMGVSGVAWATFIAQGISSVLTIITLKKRVKDISEGNSYKIFSWGMLKRISIIAIPSILQQSFVSVGSLMIQGLINSYGSSVIAGYSAALKLNTFAITAFVTIANGLSCFTAQNVGAGKQERVSQGFKAAVIMIICIVAPFVFVFFGFSSEMIKIFMDSGSEKAITVGSTFLRIVSPFYIVVAIKIMADGVLRGAGAMTAFMLCTLSDLVLRVALSFVLSNWFESTGIWLSWPIGWTIASSLSCICYFKGIWKKKTV